MRELFLKYIKINNLIRNYDHSKSILHDDIFIQSVHEKSLKIEDKILQKFGLSKAYEHREILFSLTDEKGIKSVLSELKDKAKSYLYSSPKSDIELLEAAKKEDLKTYQVLPEMGIEDTLYAMFYLEEYFKKGKIDAQELITILKNIDEKTSIKMAYLRNYYTDEERDKKFEKALNELEIKGIPYLVDYINYKPKYPY
jgi:hypothetical protein